MLDILDGLLRWRADGVGFATATIVATHGSAPRAAGATMAVAETGEVLGSLSGGCVDGAVYDVALDSLESGRRELSSYGVEDGAPTAAPGLESLLEMGLTCGGVLDILVEPVTGPTLPVYDALLDHLRRGRAATLARVVGAGAAPTSTPLLITDDGEGPIATGGLGVVRWDATVIDAVRAAPPRVPGAVRAAAHTLLVQDPSPAAEPAATVLVQSFDRPSRMIIFGAIDFAAAVGRAGRFLGHHVTVCDARPVFTTAARFPDVDEIVVDWPHRYLADEVAAGRVEADTVLCVLTHDPKFDLPLLEVALQTEARYIGVMGSRRTHADRVGRLREAGVGQDGIDRLRSPIGLDLGARTPEETAVGIAAEIIGSATGRSGRPLAEVDDPIHV